MISENKKSAMIILMLKFIHPSEATVSEPTAIPTIKILINLNLYMKMEIFFKTIAFPMLVNKFSNE